MTDGRKEGRIDRPLNLEKIYFLGPTTISLIILETESNIFIFLEKLILIIYINIILRVGNHPPLPNLEFKEKIRGMEALSYPFK